MSLSRYLKVSQLLLLWGMVQAASPFATAAVAPETFPIWTASAADKFANYRIPQILVTRTGTLIACAEARYQKSDGSPVDVVIKRSRDGGRTWSKTEWVERKSDTENYVLPVLLEDRSTGRLFFFCALRDAGLHDTTTTSYFRTSDDEGVTWSARIDVTGILAAADEKLQKELRTGRAAAAFSGESPELFGRKLFFFGPGRAIQLSSNHHQHPERLVVPVFLIKDRVASPRSARAYGDAVLISDDHGKTWQTGGIVPLGAYGSSEAGVAELDDGRLVLNARGAPEAVAEKAAATRTVSFSADDGATWTRPEAHDALPRYRETHSGLLRIPAPPDGKSDNSWHLFSYPAGPDRQNGTIALSKDNHHTWPIKKLIVPGSFGYSNLDRLADGSIVVIYETRAGDQISLVRFALEWLTDGRDTFQPTP